MITEQDKNKVLEERRQKKLAREQAERERQEHLAEVNDPDVWVQVIAKHRNNHPVSYTVSFDAEPEVSIQTGRNIIYKAEPTARTMCAYGIFKVSCFILMLFLMYLYGKVGGPV